MVFDGFRPIVHRLSVNDQVKGTLQESRCLLAHDNPLHVNLQIFQHGGAVIHGQLVANDPCLAVNGNMVFLNGEIHSVVNIIGIRLAIAHPALVGIALVA